MESGSHWSGEGIVGHCIAKPAVFCSVHWSFNSDIGARLYGCTAVRLWPKSSYLVHSRVPRQRAVDGVEEIMEADARIVRGNHDEPPRRPVRDKREGLGSPPRRAVHEHDHGKASGRRRLRCRLRGRLRRLRRVRRRLPRRGQRFVGAGVLWMGEQRVVDLGGDGGCEEGADVEGVVCHTTRLFASGDGPIGWVVGKVREVRVRRSVGRMDRRARRGYMYYICIRSAAERSKHEAHTR